VAGVLVTSGVVVVRWVSRLVVGAGVLVLLVLPVAAQGGSGHGKPHAVCAGPAKGHAFCHALVTTDSRGKPEVSSGPTGLSPATIKGVYGFPTNTSTPGAGETVALVDAYDDPAAESDLNAFSSQFGLPACTTTNGCFTKVNQTGGTSYPSGDSGWALEISLDVQWAHAIAPGAKILLVEASSNSFSDLMAAEDYAKTHAQYVSNSWGASEFAGESSYDSHFVQSGVSFFVSAGDNGLPAEWPSASPNVISVGGTTLTFNSDGSLKSETGWSSGGGGCSSQETATAAQAGFAGYSQAGCGGARATPDVSLDADPNSGVSVYDSNYYGLSGWWTVGGTSASSPMWAAASADAGAVVNSAYVYGNNINFRDITSGNNGAACMVGYDLCSGRGSWLFSGSSSSQPSLSFLSNAQTATAGQPSKPMQVGLSAVQTGDVAVTLSSSSGGGTFSNSTGGPWVKTLPVTIKAGQTSSPSFYYEDTTAGAPTLSASAPGTTSTQQAEVVDAAALAKITVSPNSATVAAGANQQFTATGSDQFGNPVGVSTASWTTSAPGTVAPSSGASTVFSAGSTAGSGSVTATVGTVSGSASVTVTSLLSMTVTVNAGPATQRRLNYRVPLTVSALNASTHAPLAGAGVTLNVYSGSTCAGTVVSSASATTASNGQAGFTFSTRQHGNWCARAIVNTTGYNTGSGTTPFTT
jgi:hypothetical protein